MTAANTRLSKQALKTPHNRKPGAAAREDTRRWRRVRRSTTRWLRGMR